MTFKLGDTVYHHLTECGGTVVGSSRIAGGYQAWVRVRFADSEGMVASHELVSVTGVRVEAGDAIDSALRVASDRYSTTIPLATGLMLANVALTVLQSLDLAQRAALLKVCGHCGATTQGECRGSDLPPAYTGNDPLRETRGSAP